MDFVGGYHSKLVNDFINLFGERRTVVELLMDCQKWVWSQNCEIIKKTLSHLNFTPTIVLLSATLDNSSYHNGDLSPSPTERLSKPLHEHFPINHTSYRYYWYSRSQEY